MPRNKVPDDLENIINIRFFYLYEYFNYEERIKDAAMLEIIREDIRELTEHLVSAASLSNMVPSAVNFNKTQVGIHKTKFLIFLKS